MEVFKYNILSDQEFTKKQLIKILRKYHLLSVGFVKYSKHNKSVAHNATANQTQNNLYKFYFCILRSLHNNP